MTPKTQSVCKHCQHPPAVHDHLGCAMIGCECKQFEPVSEPASTGEPTLTELIDQYWGPPLKSFEPARPSEPSAPQMYNFGGLIDAFDLLPNDVAEQIEVLGRHINELRKWVEDYFDPENAAPQTSAEDEALPREAAPILAALFNSLIEQNCPDSVSGYTIFDAMWPKIQAFAAPQPVSGDAPGIKVKIYDPIAYLQELYADMGKRGECEICLKLQFCIEVLKEK